jgi:hypothetical protein
MSTNLAKVPHFRSPFLRRVMSALRVGEVGEKLFKVQCSKPPESPRVGSTNLARKTTKRHKKIMASMASIIYARTKQRPFLGALAWERGQVE